MIDDRKLITIVIPSHNRHDFLSRIADFYGDGSLRVLVIDSTPKAYDHPDLLRGVEYQHAPGESFSAKTKRVLQAIDTPYVVLSGDDDFVVPAAVVYAAQRLDDDPSLSTVQGKRLSFWCHRRAMEVGQYPVEQESSMLGSSALERSRTLLSGNNYRDLFYAVHRTDELREALADCDKIPRSLYLQELLTGVHAMARGGHLFIDRLFCIRQSMLAGGTYTEDSIGSLIYQSKNSEELSKFYDLCIEYVVVNTEDSGPESSELTRTVTDLVTWQLDRQAGGTRIWHRRARSRAVLERFGLFGPRVRHLRRRARELFGSNLSHGVKVTYGSDPSFAVSRFGLNIEDRNELCKALDVVARYPLTHIG